MNKESRIYDAVEDLLTADVHLSDAPDVPVGEIWWEARGEWLYPWRITGEKTGYPCGEPRVGRRPERMENAVRNLPNTLAADRVRRLVHHWRAQDARRHLILRRLDLTRHNVWVNLRRLAEANISNV